MYWQISEIVGRLLNTTSYCKIKIKIKLKLKNLKQFGIMMKNKFLIILLVFSMPFFGKANYEQIKNIQNLLDRVPKVAKPELEGKLKQLKHNHPIFYDKITCFLNLETKDELSLLERGTKWGLEQALKCEVALTALKKEKVSAADIQLLIEEVSINGVTIKSLFEKQPERFQDAAHNFFEVLSEKLKSEKKQV